MKTEIVLQKLNQQIASHQREIRIEIDDAKLVIERVNRLEDLVARLLSSIREKGDITVQLTYQKMPA